MRLLYVALTRSVWHCSLGVAPLFRRRGEKAGDSDFHLSALGRLIQRGEPMDASGLKAAIEALCNDDIVLHAPGASDNTRWEMPQNGTLVLSARQVQRVVADDWRVTSYSGLQQRAHGMAQDLLPRLDVDAAGEREVLAEPMLTPHQFPRGASPGTFLHGLFEDLDFTQPVSAEWVSEKLQTGGFEPHWQPVISDWIEAVLQAPLADTGVALSELTAKDKQVEMEFYVPIQASLRC